MSHVTADRLDSSKADQCASEPIHIPGAIQPHGALLALDPDGLRILQAAGATAAMLGAAPEQLVGQDIANWVHPQAVDRLRAFAAGDARLGKPLPLFEMNAWADGTPIRPAGIEAAGIEAVGHSSAGVLVIEFEARPADPLPDKLPLVRTMMLRMQEAARGTEAFCQAIADEVRDVSLFDRVMVYRFLPDDAGCVVAEARDPAVESFRGLRFPAADIPAQARRLYLHNWVRTIPDRNYAPAALHPAINTLTGAPLDLSQSILRSVSPVHLEYLANLGVQASMSLSLVVDGRLWGLIACHHDTPRYPSYALRTALESFAQMVSYQLASRLAAESYEERLRSEAKCVALLARMVGERDLASVIARLAPDLAAYVAADGLVIWTGGVAVMLGRTPDHAQHEALVAWLAEAAPEGVFFTHRLQADFPPSAAYAGSASGIAAVALAPRFRDGMMWLRREVVETVNWAGAQETALEDDRLRPRKSFAVWRESVFGQSSPWSANEQTAVRALRTAMQDIVIRSLEQLAQGREEGQRRQGLLVAELDHRIKNMLATVHALLAHHSMDQGDMASFVRTFNERLQAMGRSHSLLTEHRWEGASLRAVVNATLGAYKIGAMPLAWINATADMVLKPKAALAISLALHELATNAAKYGAFSIPDGRVEIGWRIEGGSPRLLLLYWRELGGPPVRAPTRRGFGRHLIESNLSYEIDARVRLEFKPGGVEFTARVPWDQVVTYEEAAPPVSASSGRSGADAALGGRRILVVEDNAMVASSLALLLVSVGVLTVGPVGRLAAALDLAGHASMDAALLDIDIHGRPVWPVADVLASRGIPFLFATGYAPNLEIPSRFRDCVVLTKPYADTELFDALQTLCPVAAP